MAKAGGYTISDIYQGGYSSFKPSYENTMGGEHIYAGTLALTTDGRTANQLKSVSEKISAGVKHVEIPMVSPEIFDSMPKQHIKEINRLAQLTGVTLSVHAPVVDTTGITQQGFSEVNREASERKLIDFALRAQQFDPKGNIILNFHSTEGLPGSEFAKIGKEPEYRKMIAVNRESGKMIPTEADVRYYAGQEELEETLYPKEQLNIINRTEWSNSLSQVEFQRESAERILKDVHPLFRGLFLDVATGKKDPKSLSNEENEQIQKVFSAHEYMKQAEMTVQSLFSKAYKYGTPEQQKFLKDLSDLYGNNLGMKDGKRGIESFDPKTQSNAMFTLVKGLEQVQPKLYVPIEQFALDKASETFSNVAVNAYKKYGNKSPIISIENPPSGFALSTGEDLKNLIEKTKEKFVRKLVDQEKISTSEATSQADKLIGATWDVGHINMLRKSGFEAKDIVKETEKIAPHLKHIHLSDNFGIEHTELPMGMGNVPLKEMMEKLGKKGYEAKKIIEAISWWQHFTPHGGGTPLNPTLEALGSPFYSVQMAPYWNQNLGLQQGYFSGYGQMLPQTNYQMFGAGWSQLPAELGGQQPGAQGSRMSGKPME